MSYLYALGVVASREKDFVPPEIFEQMMSSKTLKQAVDALYSSSFSSFFGDDFDVQRAIGRADTQIIDFVRTESPDEQTKEFFLSPLDIDNVATVCKAKYLSIAPEPYLENVGTIPFETIKNGVNFQNLSLFKSDFIRDMLSHFFNLLSSPALSASDIDSFFKKYKYRYLKQISKNEILKNLTNLILDTENLSVCLRTQDEQTFLNQKVANGNLSNDLLLPLLHRDKTALDKITNADLHALAGCIFDTNTQQSLSKFEFLKNSLLLSQTTKPLVENTYEGFVNYVFRFVTQLKNIRMILSFKSNDLEESLERERFLGVKK